MRTDVVLVTGATGFLGSHLVSALTRRVAAVHTFSRQPSSASGVAAGSRWSGDIRDASAVDRVIARVSPDVIFHLAANTAVRSQSDPAAFAEAYDVNLTGTLNVLTACVRLPRRPRIVIRFGGLEEYGDGPSPSAEAQRERPVSPYSASQVGATYLCEAFWRQTGLPIVTLRPALTYGPGQAASFFIPGLISHALRGEPFEMTSGEQARDLIFVTDVMDASLRAMDVEGLGGEVLNIATGREYRIREVADMILRLAGSSATVRLRTAVGRVIDLATLVGDTGRAAERLHWRATTSLEDGLRMTIAAARRSAAKA